jgi:phosphoglycolate phosphatase
MKRLIVFDLDGTLLDTIGDLAAATNHALEAFDLPTHPEQAYRFFVGNGINKLIERALPEGRATQDDISMVKHEFLRYYNAHGEDRTRPYPGIVELLHELASKGYQLGVASNKYHEGTTALVSHYFAGIPFAGVLGQREGIPTKPSPYIIEEIMLKAGVTKEETLYIGDSGVDATTAINAGVDFLGVLWGFRPQSELEAAGATRFVERAEEVLLGV